MSPDHLAQVKSMSNTMAVAYWNILQYPVLPRREDHEDHITAMSATLTERGIPHERGKRTILQ